MAGKEGANQQQGISAIAVYCMRLTEEQKFAACTTDECGALHMLGAGGVEPSLNFLVLTLLDSQSHNQIVHEKLRHFGFVLEINLLLLFLQESRTGYHACSAVHHSADAVFINSAIRGSVHPLLVSRKSTSKLLFTPSFGDLQFTILNVLSCLISGAAWRISKKP